MLNKHQRPVGTAEVRARIRNRLLAEVKIPRPTKSSIQAAYEEFIGEAGQDIEIAVTLTFRDSALRMGGISARLNVEKTVRHYVNRLNKLAFGHGVGRRGQTLTVISVIEGEVSLASDFMPTWASLGRSISTCQRG